MYSIPPGRSPEKGCHVRRRLGGRRPPERGSPGSRLAETVLLLGTGASLVVLLFVAWLIG